MIDGEQTRGERRRKLRWEVTTSEQALNCYSWLWFPFDDHFILCLKNPRSACDFKDSLTANRESEVQLDPYWRVLRSRTKVPAIAPYTASAAPKSSRVHGEPRSSLRRYRICPKAFGYIHTRRAIPVTVRCTAGSVVRNRPTFGGAVSAARPASR